MNNKIFSKKVSIVLCILLLSFVTIFIFNINLNHFKGQFCGIVQNNGKNQIAVCNIKAGTFTIIKDIKLSKYIEYATVNNTGTKTAYTKWDKTLKNQYLIIENKFGKNLTYGKVNNPKETSQIYTPMFINNGKDLLCVRAFEKYGYPLEKLVIFNLKTKKEKIIDYGQLIMNNEEDFNNSIIKEENGKEIVHIFNQTQLNSMLDKYKASHRSLNNIGSRLFIKYSRPTYDYENNRIIFAKTLYQNFVTKGDAIILSSILWSYDIDSGKKEILYEGNHNCLIGKVDCKPNGTAVIFSESMITGEDSKIIEFSFKQNGKIKYLVYPDDKHYANIDPMYLDNNHITYLSIAKDDLLDNAIRYTLDLENGKAKKVYLKYENKKELIKFFNKIY